MGWEGVEAGTGEEIVIVPNTQHTSGFSSWLWVVAVALWSFLGEFGTSLKEGEWNNEIV